MYASIYNPNRQYLFILRQVQLFKNRWLIAAGALFGVLLLISLLTAYYDPAGLQEVFNLHALGFYFAGFIFSSQMFMELHSPNQAYNFLSLPVSTLEKLLGSWLLSSPLYTLLYTAASYTIYLLSSLIAGTATPVLPFFGEAYWEIVSTYLVLQTIFLWGACYFRKNNFLKTVLSLIVFAITLGLYAGLVVWLLFGPELKAEVEISKGAGLEDFMVNVFAPISNFIFWGVFGPFMLLISYFTLKERQL